MLADYIAMARERLAARADVLATFEPGGRCEAIAAFPERVARLVGPPLTLEHWLASLPEPLPIGEHTLVELRKRPKAEVVAMALGFLAAALEM